MTGNHPYHSIRSHATELPDDFLAVLPTGDSANLKIFLLFCSPASSLLTSSSPPHLPLSSQPCGGKMLWWIRPYTPAHLHPFTVFRVSPKKKTCDLLEGHHLHDYIHGWGLLPNCLLAVFVNWPVLIASQSPYETDVVSSEVPLEFLALQKSLDPAKICQHAWQWSASQVPRAGD